MRNRSFRLNLFPSFVTEKGRIINYIGGEKKHIYGLNNKSCCFFFIHFSIEWGETFMHSSVLLLLLLLCFFFSGNRVLWSSGNYTKKIYPDGRMHIQKWYGIQSRYSSNLFTFSIDICTWFLTNHVMEMNLIRLLHFVSTIFFFSASIIKANIGMGWMCLI